MLCACCYRMLRGQKGLQWRGSYDLHFHHHENEQALRESAKTCFICQTIVRELPERGWLDWFPLDSSFARLFSGTNQQEEGRFRASLSKLPDNAQDFLLEFYHQDLEIGAFALKTSEKPSPPSSMPGSYGTGSDTAFPVISSWIKTCNCVNVGTTPVYPTRLIDLHDLKERISLEEEPTSWSNEKKPPPEVRLVHGEGLSKRDKQENSSYVTLSHCWGGKKIFRLTKGEYYDRLSGIQLSKLPQTFQDAMKFAARIDQVRYIWIDSLCIVQDDDQDWLRESSRMADIYSNAFLNIAATAARNSFEGLYPNRGPRWLWNDEINLNVGEMPGMEGPPIRRCTITDISFWDAYVDRAPLNMRGWVLQERLMSPRQVNFCSGQVTWECREGRRSERQPEGLSKFKGRAQEHVHGAVLQNLPLNGASGEMKSDHDPALILRGSYNSWKYIVERYTQAKLTIPKDKLIALSGIAQRMHARINHILYSPRCYDPRYFDAKKYKRQYLAGMWDYNLQCQLLWYVEPRWDARHQRFHYLSTRPKQYRAPSWSWAAVDADYGIKYGGISEHELLFQVVDIKVSPDDGGLFGTVECGLLVIGSDVQPKEIELQKSTKNGGTTYSWRMVESDGKRLENTFCIVCLDSPASDWDIFALNARICCLPAARSHQKTEFTCLILQELSLQDLSSQERSLQERSLQKRDAADERRYFKRVGLTSIPSLDATSTERLKSWISGNGNRRHEFYIF